MWIITFQKNKEKRKIIQNNEKLCKMENLKKNAESLIKEKMDPYFILEKK